ncbi:MAG: hypothetical protein ACI3T9_01005 [Romboutsia timonensis]
MNTRKYSSQQEKRVAKNLGGKVNANSGATAFSKGDVRTNYLLVECKTSTKEVKSVSIKKEWLKKLNEERFAMGKQHAVLAFDFGDGEDYYIIDKNLMNMLHDYLEDIYG